MDPIYADSRCKAIAFSLVLATVLCGCHRAPSKYSVGGEITWQGEPLAAGDVFFMGEDQVSSEAAKIENGKYRTKARPGRFTVMINSPVRKRNPNPPGMRADEYYYENFIPPRYNEQTSLRVEVLPQDDNRFDFALTE